MQRIAGSLLTALLLLSSAGAALADPTTMVLPSNQQTVDPQSSANAQSANVNTQINTTNLGLNSFAPGVSCAGPQLAINGYTQGLNNSVNSSFVGAGGTQLVNTSGTTGSTGLSANGLSIGYVTPVSLKSTRECQALAHEITRQRQLDTQITLIGKCLEYQKAGVLLDPAVFPEFRICQAVKVAQAPPAPLVQTVIQRVEVPVPLTPVIKHLSDFTPRPLAAQPPCVAITPARKRQLLRALKADAHRTVSRATAAMDGEYLRELKAACVPDAEIFQGIDG
jgi:hypothetical protein